MTISLREQMFRLNHTISGLTADEKGDYPT